MSDVFEAQGLPVRSCSTGCNGPQPALASDRDPAMSLPTEIAQILDMIESDESWGGRATPEVPHTDQPVAAVDCASYFRVKPMLDRTITAVLMIVALPLMLAVGLAILLFDGRPIFYRQTRVGWLGRHFKIWKFRTMCRNAECGTGAIWSCDSDPRVTKLGRWLRLLHLDELPQFFNVLAGEMSLVGPRPERPEFVNKLVKSVPLYGERLKVRPGISGLAQLQLGYDRSVAGVQDKVVMDLAYIQSANIFFDAKILMATLPFIASNFFWKRKDAPESSKEPVASRKNLEKCLTLHMAANSRSTVVKYHSSVSTEMTSLIRRPNSTVITSPPHTHCATVSSNLSSR